MNLESLTEEIESIQFSASVAVMSGFRSLLHMLAKKDSIKQLVLLLRAEPHAASKIADRIMVLLSSEISSEFQHSSDAALLGYLFALNAANEPLALQIAHRFVVVPNLFWARRLAESIIQDAAPQTEQTVVVSE